MAAALARPGIEVVQVFTSTSPTIITPTLVPCVLGVCRQVVQALTTTNAGSQQLNSQALVTLPALLIAEPATGDPPLYTGFDGKGFSVSVNNGITVPLVFTDSGGTGLSPEALVGQITKQFATNGVTAAVADVVGTTAFHIRTVGVGDFQSIEVMAGDVSVLSTLGFAVGRIEPGLSTYHQNEIDIHQANLPDPHNNLALLSIESETIRAFLSVGNGMLLELTRTQSFLRHGGTAGAAMLEGTIDLTTLTFATKAIVTGNVDLVANAGTVFGVGGTLDTKVLNYTFNGIVHAITFAAAGNAANAAAMLAAIQTQIGVGGTVALVAGSNFLRFTDALYGTPSSIIISAGSAAAVLGLAVATTTGVAGTLGNSSTTFATDGGANIAVTWTYPHDVTSLLAQINGTAGIGLVATEDSGTHELVLTSPTTGPTSQVKVVSGTGGTVAALGFTNGQTSTGTAAIIAIDDGNGDAFTPLIQLNGVDLTTPATQATVTGSVDITTLTLLAGKTLTLSDGDEPQTYTFAGVGADPGTLIELNDFFGAPAGGKITATATGGHHLILTSSDKGEESMVKIVGGTAVSMLGLTVSEHNGSGFPPAPGDVLYINGALYANVVQVAPGGQTSVIKVDRQVPINSNVGSTFYFIAKNLTGPATTTRPSSDLVVDLNGNLLLKHEVLRDTTGAPIPGAKCPIYIAYNAVREDVTALHSQALLNFGSTTALEAQLSPITTDNPLGLGLYFALLNAPGINVTGIGVDSISSDEPYGTVDAYATALSFLESFEVYAIAPMTSEESVGQLLNTHVNVMSDPTQRGERIGLFNPTQPTSKQNTIIASGTNGNSTSNVSFDTGIVNLPALLLNAGIDPTTTIPASAGVFLDIAADSRNYSIQNVSGGVVTIRTTFPTGANDDEFYATTDLETPPLPPQLIEEAFSVNIRGAPLRLPNGTVDKQSMATTYQGQALAFANRRFWRVLAATCTATVGGLAQALPGFYLCAAIAGMIGQQPPSQSFTNFPMTGFTAVSGTSGFFTEAQLDLIAGGGNYIVVQDTQGAPLISRMALTSDVTSLETRTDSVTKVVDFTAKFLRGCLKNYIGRFNVTQGFLDSLSHVIQGCLSFLEETGVIIGADLNNIIQDEKSPDTVLIDITLDVPFPCNYIRLTLSI